MRCTGRSARASDWREFADWRVLKNIAMLRKVLAVAAIPRGAKSPSTTLSDALAIVIRIAKEREA